MKVYFLDSYNNKKEIAEVQTKKEVWSVINKFLEEKTINHIIQECGMKII